MDDEPSAASSDFEDDCVSEEMADYSSADEVEEVLLHDEEEFSYKVITRESLLAAQSDDLRTVADMLGIKQQHARTLLIHHRWDFDRLCGNLAEEGKDRLFLEAGLPPDASATPCSRISESLPDPFTCETCFDEGVPPNAITTMDCGHSFCNTCWTEHFLVKIVEGQSRRIKCMAHNCKAICDEDAVKKLVAARDREAAEKFERFLLESYIEDNSKVKWCPSVPHCGNAIRVDGDPYCEVECICSKQFCFNCAAEAHSPCSCLMWQLWDKKCKDESETANWLTAHTKPCPKCQKPVEKNGGCNLVGCICGQAFCWLCGAATGREHNWTSIDGHSCGRYKEDKEKEAARAERDLKRYMHYFSRWQAHIHSLKLEAKQKEVVQEKIAKLEASESLVKDYSWLTNGLHRLFRARKALSYSYAFAFFMFGNDLFKDEITPEDNEIYQNLFEDQQQQLEGTIERLSKAIETPFEFNVDDSQVSEVRLQVLNLTALTDNLCRKMYECIENDLLGKLQLTTHHIANYNSRGAVKASEIRKSEVDIAPKPIETASRSLHREAGSGKRLPLHQNPDGEGVVADVGEPSRRYDYAQPSGDSSSGRKRLRCDFDLNNPPQDCSRVVSASEDPSGDADTQGSSHPSTSSSSVNNSVSSNLAQHPYKTLAKGRLLR